MHGERRPRKYVRRTRASRITPAKPLRRRRSAPPPEPAGAVARSPRQSLRLAALVFLQYALLAIDVRFVASANYLGIAVANVAIATTTWYVTRDIVTARTAIDRVCFAVGGASGALVAVYLT